MLDVLILGYGNTLRGDDALGVHAAHALHDFYCTDGGIRVLATSQLTFDLAEDISQAQFILFIDAAIGGPPGDIRSEEVRAADEKVRFTHHWTPRTLLMLARQLYGTVPSAISLTMAVGSSEVGVGLSQEVQRNLPALLERAKSFVSEWRRSDSRDKAANSIDTEVDLVKR